MKRVVLPPSFIVKFNLITCLCRTPNEKGMISTPIEFIEGYRGEDLKEKMKVIKHGRIE